MWDLDRGTPGVMPQSYTFVSHKTLGLRDALLVFVSSTPSTTSQKSQEHLRPGGDAVPGRRQVSCQALLGNPVLGNLQEWS